MCGIFGLVTADNDAVKLHDIRKSIKDLFVLSESRGKEAAGIALNAANSLFVYKEPQSASKMLRSQGYRDLWVEADRTTKGEDRITSCAVIGHSRLVTNGLQGISTNNQPVVKDGIVGIHNGIIVNDEDLWEKNTEIEQAFEVDTEVILSLTRKYLNLDNPLSDAIGKTFGDLEGSASIAFFFEDLPYLTLATNTGSLYYTHSSESNQFIFASEKFILNEFLVKTRLISSKGQKPAISQLLPGTGIAVNTEDLSLEHFQFASPKNQTFRKRKNPLQVVDHSKKDETRLASIRRCKRCVLPETFPMIRFDENGICNICNDYKPIQHLGKEKLHELAEKHRSKNGEPDCIVAFSGGRDSSYMLHYVKTELGLNPIAYGYDWGMVTDIARRNQARITGKLGIEYIVVSADIREKRRNIQRNLNAWLKRPSLGMIPIFMAGDKQYFYHLARLRKQLGIELAFLGGNPLEKTGFKSGFTGVKETGKRTYDISSFGKLQIAWYYLKQFLTNPTYLNKSLFDTAFAYYSSYMLKHDFTWLFRYIPWDETEINTVLQKEYQWEVATDTETTWRIGDGTSAFYNYIYNTVAGFSENDTLRSNQIREGMITREEALTIVEKDNEPRYETMREYAYQVGFNLDEALFIINSIPKLY